MATDSVTGTSEGGVAVGKVRMNRTQRDTRFVKGIENGVRGLRRTQRLAACAVLASATLLIGAHRATADDMGDPSIEERLEDAEQMIRGLQREVEGLRQQQQQVQAEVPPEAEPTDFRVFWKDGLRAETRNKKFTTRIGGRIQNDWVAGTMSDDLQDELIGIDPDTNRPVSIGDFKNGVEFRRARLYIQGTMYDHIIYKAQYDFAGGDADFKDVYLGLRNIPHVGTIKVGQFKEPFSLEELTSSNYITFLERSLPNVFAPGRSTGIMATNTAFDDRMTWAGGYFRDSDDFGDEASDEEYVLTGRVTALPIYQDRGRMLLHLGAAGRTRQIGDDEARFQARPEIHKSQRFIDTGTFDAKNETSFGAEAALVCGSGSLQAEYMRHMVDTPGSTDPWFDGFYVLGSYFLTGEHRPYSTSAGAFSAVKPRNNFSMSEGTWGAWELAARYSQADLNDSGITGGELRNTTMGLNWYLNPNVRLMANWVHAYRKTVGDGDLFGMRFQVFF